MSVLSVLVREGVEIEKQSDLEEIGRGEGGWGEGEKLVKTQDKWEGGKIWAVLFWQLFVSNNGSVITKFLKSVPITSPRAGRRKREICSPVRLAAAALVPRPLRGWKWVLFSSAPSPVGLLPFPPSAPRPPRALSSPHLVVRRKESEASARPRFLASGWEKNKQFGRGLKTFLARHISRCKRQIRGVAQRATEFHRCHLALVWNSF